MAGQDLKSNAVSGALWTGLEKVAVQIIQFGITIVIARILSPKDYGVVGMLTIFIAIAQTFADSGLGSALIQKNNCTDADYSTIFYFNMAVAISLYLIIFFISPLIAAFYDMPILEDVARVTALSLIFSALTAVQRTRLTIALRFKEQSLIAVATTVITGVTGLILAMRGWGVWALVFQTLAGQVFSSVCIWYVAKWRPLLVFSIISFCGLWKFGSRILCSSLINTVYSNLYTLIIGKVFTSAEVGYFNRANQFSTLPTNMVQEMAIKVNYPILAKLKDDNTALLRAYHKLMTIPLFLLYPILSGMIVVAPYLIPLLIGDKWIPCVPFLQILCIGCMFTPLTHFNLNLLYVKGRTDLVLKLEFIKKPLYFLTMCISIPFGIEWIIVSKAFNDVLAFTINCYYTNKILDYGLGKQLRNLSPIFANCLIMMAVISFAVFPFDADIVKLLVGIVTGVLTYLFFSVITKDSSFTELYGIIKSKIKKE